MALKPKKARRESENSEVLNWTDNEVELLLRVARSYSSQKDFDGLEWKSVKSKYEDIRSEFVRLYDERNDQEDSPLKQVSFLVKESPAKWKILEKSIRKP